MTMLKDIKDEVREKLIKMNPEQLADYFDFALEVGEFAEKMKSEFADVILKNTKPIGKWKDITSKNIQYNLLKKVDELTNGKDKEITIANWALIHWFNKHKQNGK